MDVLLLTLLVHTFKQTKKKQNKTKQKEKLCLDLRDWAPPVKMDIWNYTYVQLEVITYNLPIYRQVLNVRNGLHS